MCRDRWSWNWTWLNTNTHTLWPCEISAVKHAHWQVPACHTGCGLDIRVQGHFLKCALGPPYHHHHPSLHLISSIPKQKLLLWETRSATCVSVWSPNLHASRLSGRRRVCIQFWEHFSSSQAARGHLFDLFKITTPKQSAHQDINSAHPNTEVKTEGFTAQAVFITTLRLWSRCWVGGVYPGGFPLSEQAPCLACFSWTRIPSPHQSSQREQRKGRFSREAQ